MGLGLCPRRFLDHRSLCDNNGSLNHFLCFQHRNNVYHNKGTYYHNFPEIKQFLEVLIKFWLTDDHISW